MRLKSTELFLLMLNLSQINNKKEIKRIYVEAINNLFNEIKIEITDEPLIEASENLAVKYENINFGNIAILNDFSVLSNEDQSLLRNSIGLLSIILQNKTYAEKLKEENISLEKLSRRIQNYWQK